MIKNTLFVTFPRSGHHLLMDCLQEYFGEEMHYCENYHHCNTVPCTDPTTNVQKTHDFDLDVKQDKRLIVVQVRAKPDAVQSWAELKCRESWYPERIKKWIKEAELFYDRWFMKWVIGGSFPVVTYERLTTHPVRTISTAVRQMTDMITVDTDRIEEIVKKFDIEPRRWS